MSHRMEKVERSLHETVANYLITGYKGGIRGLVTVKGVSVSKDLQHAKIFVSVLGSPEDKEFTSESLSENVLEIQNFVGRNLQMRYCPKLKIVVDTSVEL
ncbi:MAG: 30S ribosome-binding factor RbfA [Bdellovibrionia bacterium]